ncbi:TPA: AAA family ATPase [Bacillus cereus]|nr:AAA family ATPase [Bacillus cereus]HDR3910859.1 AAA family ATPase [Bacillus cereus]HDR3914950.1 AAA family ATPase [Bacillus cereus]HDV7169683.1 AAA family ATPase [Bacillus cereus]HDV7173054.1 AAA family ATPase [Bacillus cereus]
MEYIFLSGIHGVGKSTLVKKLQNDMDLEAFSVSDLIRKAGNNIKISQKSTGNISRNQEMWKSELNNLELTDSKLVLDGHFCLLNSKNEIKPLDFETFKGTNMSKIIFMKNNPQVIKERLFKRDRIKYSIELLADFQEFEMCQANKYSQENDIELFMYDEIEPYSELIRFIKS